MSSESASDSCESAGRFVQDLWNIGKAIGILGFRDEDDNNDKLREMTRDISRAKRIDKRILAENEGEARDALHRMVQGKEGEGTLSGAQKAVDQNFKRENAKWMSIIRAKYQGAVIRRTVNSLDHRGRPISGLDPYEEHICMLKLHRHEYAALEKLAEDALDDESFARRFCSEVSDAIELYQLTAWMLTVQRIFIWT